MPTRPRSGRTVLVLLVAFVITCSPLAPGSRAAFASLGANDYPANLASPAKDTTTDPWSFWNRECTSFVAFRLNTYNGVSFSDYTTASNGQPVHWGNAANWSAAAQAMGYPVNATPAPGSVAWWPANYHTASKDGHVAYVDSVKPDGSIAIEEYNASVTGGYDLRTLMPGSSTWPMSFIHIADLGAVSSAPRLAPVQMLIDNQSAVLAKTPVSYGNWTAETSPGNALAIAGGGSYQQFLRSDSAVFARNGLGSNWTQETSPGTVTAIAISSTGVQMIRTPDAAIFDKSSISYGGWSQIVGPGNAKAIAVGGNIEMFLRGDGAVFARAYGQTGWYQEFPASNVTAIAVTATGMQMILEADGTVLATAFIAGTWSLEAPPGSAKAIAAGQSTQMYIGRNSAVYAKSSIGLYNWTQETDSGNAVGISVMADGTQLFRRWDGAVFATHKVGASWLEEADPGTTLAIAAG